jgi:hypothetical protein
MAAAMVGKTIGRTIEEGQVPMYVECFGSTKDEILVTASEMRKELGGQECDRFPTGVLGLFTYCERSAQGQRQLVAGSRKFSCAHISCDDLSALTSEAAETSGITYVRDLDRAEAQVRDGDDRGLTPAVAMLLQRCLN